MYKAIIFDFFNVIRTDPYQAWLRRYGIKREGEYAEASKPLDRGELALADFYKKLERLSGHPATTVEHEYNNTRSVDKEIAKLIEGLRHNYKIGLLSNSGSEYLRSLLGRYSLEGLFDTVAISAEIGHIKPSKEAFYYVLEHLQVVAQQSIFIDDNPHNVEAAQALGITGIVFQNLKSLEADLSRHDIKLK